MHTALLVSRELHWALALARAWVVAGDAVTVVLLDAAVTAARRGHADNPAVGEAMDAGVAVCAEERALGRRRTDAHRLVDGVKVIDLDEVADLVADGADKAVWL